MNMNNIIQALKRINEALGGTNNDAINIINALQNIDETLGGTNSDAINIVDVLNQIAENLSEFSNSSDMAVNLTINDGSVTGYTVDITIPNSVTSIGNNAFQGYPSLSSITIPDSVISIGSDVFYNCSSLTTINCGFAENAVSGAPWGASNATINYNVPISNE